MASPPTRVESSFSIACARGGPAEERSRKHRAGRDGAAFIRSPPIRVRLPSTWLECASAVDPHPGVWYDGDQIDPDTLWKDLKYANRRLRQLP